MKSSLASKSENCTLIMCICFFIVLFLAPVTPELQCEPKLMQEISSTANNFAASGGDSLSSSDCVVDALSQITDRL